MTLAWFALGAAGAALAGVLAGGPMWLPALALPAAAGWLFLRRRGMASAGRAVLLGAAVSLVWLTAYGAVFHAPADALANRTVRLEAVVTDWPEADDYGVRIPVKAGAEGGRRVKAVYYGGEDLLDLAPGDRLASVAYCAPADAIRGQESFYYVSRGILLRCRGYGQVTVVRHEGFPLRYGLSYLARSTRSLIDRLYPPEQAGLLRALLTGDRSGIGEIRQNQLNRVGLGHVLVISGLHVSFLAGLLSLFLKPGRRGTFPATAAVLILFCLMTGSAPGTVRAVILNGLALLALASRREYNPLTGLAAALLLLLAVNPWSVANAGLQFSFLSTLGIQAFGVRWTETWTERVPKRARRWVRPLFAVIAISLSAMLLTVPLSALYFGRFSLIAPLSNLLTGWAVMAAFAGGAVSVLAGALLFPLGQALALLVGLPVRYFLWVAGGLSRVPLAALSLGSVYYILWMGFVYLLLALWLFVPARGKRPAVPVCAGVIALCLSALLTAGTVRRADMTLTALDVGQGQSLALCSGASAVLIDCGGSLDPGDTAAAWFQSMGRRSIDLLVLTHFHEDHAGGAAELLTRLEVGGIALPDVETDSVIRREIEAIASEQNIPLYYIRSASAVELDRGRLTLLPPVQEEGDGNEQCLSVLCSAGDWDALVTGDMPAEGEALLLTRYDLPDLELFVAGHHGSKYATGEYLLKTLTPETVLISVGRNAYGHPAPETLDRLARAGAAVYRTDQLGDLTARAGTEEAT